MLCFYHKELLTLEVIFGIGEKEMVEISPTRTLVKIGEKIFLVAEVCPRGAIKACEGCKLIRGQRPCEA